MVLLMASAPVTYDDDWPTFQFEGKDRPHFGIDPTTNTWYANGHPLDDEAALAALAGGNTDIDAAIAARRVAGDHAPTDPDLSALMLLLGNPAPRLRPAPPGQRREVFWDADPVRRPSQDRSEPPHRLLVHRRMGTPDQRR